MQAQSGGCRALRQGIAERATRCMRATTYAQQKPHAMRYHLQALPDGGSSGQACRHKPCVPAPIDIPT